MTNETQWAVWSSSTFGLDITTPFHVVIEARLAPEFVVSDKQGNGAAVLALEVGELVSMLRTELLTVTKGYFSATFT